MRLAITACLAASWLSACGEPPADAVAAPASAPALAPESRPEQPASKPAVVAFRGRSGELVNPDDTTMVLLYFDLAELPAPIDQYLEDDMRVRMARPADKPAQREVVRKELEAGLKGVHGVGAIRLSMHANLSEYDSAYGEFTVRALAPSSVVEFKALGQKVRLKFGKARNAQVWRVAAEQAQGVRDRIGFSGDVSLDALLAIRDVHAAPESGTIMVNVIEYELRENRGGTLLGRVQPAP